MLVYLFVGKAKDWQKIEKEKLSRATKHEDSLSIIKLYQDKLIIPKEK